MTTRSYRRFVRWSVPLVLVVALAGGVVAAAGASFGASPPTPTATTLWPSTSHCNKESNTHQAMMSCGRAKGRVDPNCCHGL
jgi:hypothetical protein